jgi:tetratricopeptide (TPR) repeat protein
MRKRTFFFVLVLLYTFAFTKAFAKSVDYVAFSMKEAQRRLQDAAQTGVDFRKTDPLLNFLGGITKPAFLVLDVNSGDWILVGQQEANGQPLQLDDWVVALRAAFLHRTSEPGVSIDPVFGDENEGGGQVSRFQNLKTQKVRFFGGIEGSEFGRVCLDSDWLLKRIGGGFDESPVPNVRTYFDLMCDQVKKSGDNNVSIMTRFWFSPIVNRVNVMKDLVLIERFQMGVFPEVMFAQISGKPIQNPQSYHNSAAEDFARSFSDNYDALASKLVILDKLRSLTRLSAVAKGVSQMETPPDVKYFLNSYVLPRVILPTEKIPITNRNDVVGMQFSGGVELLSLTLRLRSGDATALRDIVVRGRSGNNLTWKFSVDVENGRPTSVSIPVLSDSSEMASLVSQGWFLYQKQRFGDAVECFNRVLGTNTDGMEDVLWAKAVALRDQGISGGFLSKDSESVKQQHVLDAIAIFQKIIKLNPHYSPAYFQLGATLNGFGKYDDAINALTNAIFLDPVDAEAHYTLSHAFKSRGDLENSQLELQKALSLDNDHSLPQDVSTELKSLESEIAKQKHGVSGRLQTLHSYEDTGHRFAFKYPDDWQVLDADQLSAKSRGMMTAGSGSDIVLSVANPNDWDQNFILKIPNGRMDGELSVDQINQFATQLDQGMPQTYPNFQKLSQRAIKISGVNALEYNMQAPRLGDMFQTKEVIFTKGGHAFILVCTGKQGVFEKLDNEYFKTIIKTFDVKN